MFPDFYFYTASATYLFYRISDWINFLVWFSRHDPVQVHFFKFNPNRIPRPPQIPIMYHTTDYEPLMHGLLPVHARISNIVCNLYIERLDIQSNDMFCGIA